MSSERSRFLHAISGPGIFGVLLLVAALWLILGSYKSVLAAIDLRDVGKTVEAEIIWTGERAEDCDSCSSRTVQVKEATYCFIVEEDGSTICGDVDRESQLGEKVLVVYNPHNPRVNEVVRESGLSSVKLAIFQAILAGGLGILLGLGGIEQLRKAQRWRMEEL